MSHDPDQARAIAATLRDAVRRLGCATTSAGGLEHPSDVRAILTELAVAADLLPQALTRLSAWLAAEVAAGRVAESADYGGDPDAASRAVADALHQAGGLAHQLSVMLTAAQEAAGGLGPCTPSAVVLRLPE